MVLLFLRSTPEIETCGFFLGLCLVSLTGPLSFSLLSHWLPRSDLTTIFSALVWSEGSGSSRVIKSKNQYFKDFVSGMMIWHDLSHLL